MRIAIPTTDGRLTEHFGRCEAVTIADCDEAEASINALRVLGAPAHEHGVLPRWLKQLGVNVVIAGNMGVRAQAHLERLEIRAITGAPVDTADALVRAYLNDSLLQAPHTCTGSGRHCDGKDHACH